MTLKDEIEKLLARCGGPGQQRITVSKATLHRILEFNDAAIYALTTECDCDRVNDYCHCEEERKVVLAMLDVDEKAS